MMQMNRDSLASVLGLFSHGPVKVLAITAAADRTTESVERLLDGNGLLAEFYDHDRHRSWVAVVRQRDAEFYKARLASGLVGCTVCDTLDGAQGVIGDVMFS